MKTLKLAMLTISVVFGSNQMVVAQSSGTTEKSKIVSNGTYSGTYKLENNNVLVLYQSKDGTAGLEFDANANFVKEHNDESAWAIYLTEATDASTSENVQKAKEVKNVDVYLTGTAFGGGMRYGTGTLKLSSTEKFVGNVYLDNASAQKMKAEDTWKTLPIGSKAIIPEEWKLLKFKAKNGRYKLCDFSKQNNDFSITPAGGYIQAAGIVVEKVSIKSPPPYNMNRLAIFKTGKEESNNIHIMPYAMQAVGNGTSARDNLIVMTMPVNIISTVKSHKDLSAPSEDRGNLYIYEIDKDNKIIAEQIHKSPLRTVNYDALATKDKTIIIGTGKEGSGYRLFYAGQKMEGVSIAVLDKEGTIVHTHSYLEKDFNSKVEEAGTGKVKANMKFTNGPTFISANTLDNGNIFIFGQSDGYYHGVLLNQEGALIKYYLFPHKNGKDFKALDYQLKFKGNNIYFVQADQPNSLTNEKQSDTKSYNTGTMKITTTTTKQLFEIFHQSTLYSINGSNGNSSKTELTNIVKGFHTMGDTPALFAEDGIYFAGKTKAPKGNTISLIKIPYQK